MQTTVYICNKNIQLWLNDEKPYYLRLHSAQTLFYRNIGFNLGSGHKVKRSQQPMQHARHDPEQGGGQKERGRPEVDDDDDDGAIGKVIGFFDNADRQQSGLSLLGKVFGASNTKLQLEFDPRYTIILLFLFSLSLKVLK